MAADIESYAVDLFHQWGVGSKSKDSGVLILYAIDDHRARIEVGYGLEPILTDGKVSSFQREAIPLMRSGNYSQALLLVTSRVANVIAQDAGVQLTTPQFGPSSGGTGAAAGRRNIGRWNYLADRHRTHRSFYSASRHTFLDALFWNVWWWRRIPGRRRLGWRRVWRWWWFWRIRRGQFRWWRRQQQLVVSEAHMVPEKTINDFVARLRAAAGANLESVILFGSAVAGDFHPEFSNVNLFCVIRDSSFAALQALAPAVKWWDAQKQPPPLFMTRDEIERSVDVFTIELIDMQQHHRVLFGEDVVQGLSIPPNLHRVQVEYELREKLALLRQHLLLASGNDSRMWELLLRSVSSFATLFRHALIVLGDDAPVGKREAVQALAKRIGFDASGILASAGCKRKEIRSQEARCGGRFFAISGRAGAGNRRS